MGNFDVEELQKFNETFEAETIAVISCDRLMNRVREYIEWRALLWHCFPPCFKKKFVEEGRSIQAMHARFSKGPY